ncbi:helix-turn-helix domain-containing protein [Nonomuraea polychroma]|uniref:helix-turn-helix domain-containing protein n=1 Tax=Nonomuraea polychroma TaxID=46176 RepID=UPI003D8E45B6
MSVTDAARLLGRSREYLYAGLREKRFPGAQFGRSWGILRAFVEEFLAQAEVGRVSNFDEFAAAWLAKTHTEVAV